YFSTEFKTKVRLRVSVGGFRSAWVASVSVGGFGQRAHPHGGFGSAWVASGQRGWLHVRPKDRN
ncbi:hypothetical protein J6590_104670, partial [Homalodisca vitripennis]